jgi:hypothetical protein
MLQDFYNGLEEEQQKMFKGVIILLIFILPLMGLGFLWLQNDSLRADLELRRSIVAEANKIIGQSKSLQETIPQIISMNPVDSDSMMTSRISGILTSMGIDLSKMRIEDFSAESISAKIMKSEAKFAFSNVSTEELMNILTAMILREKFRISHVEIIRNADTNSLQGSFQGIHYSAVSETVEE